MPIHWAAAFTLGCGAVLWKAEPWPWLTLIPVLCLAAWSRIRPAVLALLLGALLTEGQMRERLESQWPVARHGEQVAVQGWISTLPDRIDATERTGWRFIFTPIDDASDALPERIRASWYDGPEALAAGSCWTLTLRMRAPRGSVNPGTFDYERWLFRSGIGATASVRDAQPCDGAMPAPTRAQRLDLQVLALRAHWVDRLDRRLGDHPGAVYLRALGVGDGSGLGDERWEIFRRTGTAHLMVISGLHLALITGLGYGLLRVLWPLWPPLALRLPTPWAAGVGAGVLATVYAALAGFEPPVMRALLTVWLALFIAWRGGWRSPYRSLALIWVLLVAWDPLRLLRPGLWLSFTAVAAITYWVAFRARNRPGWQTLVGLQVGLGLVMVPLTLGFFGGATAIAPLVNLVAVPLFTLLTPLALIAGLANALFDNALVATGVHGVAALFGWVDAGLAWAAAAGERLWWQRPVGGVAALSGVLAVLLLLAPRGLPGKWLGLACLLPMLVPASSAAPPLTVAVLDVGQGTAVVVATPNHTLLYDAGPSWDGGFDAGAAIVVPYLRHLRRDTLDVLMVSHGDRDHAGGVAAVRQAFPDTVLRGAGTDDPCHAGQRWEWDGVRFDVLHPATGRHDGGGHRNNRSCVLRIRTGDQRVLLAGDIEAAAERALLDGDRTALQADLLLVPHHGSRTSSTGAFIDAVRPDAAVVSAGWRHHFGHPHRDVLQRYAARDVTVWNTAVHGALIWHLDGTDALPDPTAWRWVTPRRWRAAALP